MEKTYLCIKDLQNGDLVIVVGGSPKEAHTNFLKIEEIK